MANGVSGRTAGGTAGASGVAAPAATTGHDQGARARLRAAAQAVRSHRPVVWLVLYLATVVGLTLLHSPALLAVSLCLALLASGPRRWWLLRRAVAAVLAFNLSVSLGYALVAGWQGSFSGHYLLLVNLRVLLLVFLGFWFVSRVNLLQALAFSPTLALVATLAVGQAAVFARTLRDFRLAFRSRNPVPAGWHDQARHAAAQAAHLLDKSTAAATDAALAMRSRGCFDD